MGNCLSCGDNASALREMVARPGDSEVTLTETAIRDGLKAVADILNKQKLNISIVAVGGVVNTLLLKSRSSTGDVDFFSSTKGKSAEIMAILNAAMKVSKSKGIAKGWLNNQTAVFIKDESIVEVLYKEAIAQNEIVFSAPGLKVYAAPWRYGIVTKLSRIGSGSREYDRADAAAYLMKVVEKRGSPVKSQEIKGWVTEFKFTSMPKLDASIAELGTYYEKTYKKKGIM